MHCVIHLSIWGLSIISYFIRKWAGNYFSLHHLVVSNFLQNYWVGIKVVMEEIVYAPLKFTLPNILKTTYFTLWKQST